MAQELTQEQLKALQEKIKQMYPEELKEFQKKQCIFCQIVAGKVQSRKVYEDDIALGILDINPANPGHTLLLTKEHYSIMPQIPADEVQHVFMVVKALSNAMLRGIDAQGTNIIVANGVAAGQRAQHFMVHIIPRKENDNVEFVLPQKTMTEKEIDEIGDKLVEALGTVKKEQKEQPAHLKTDQLQKPKEKTRSPADLKAPEEQQMEKQKPKGSEINLDDIAKFLGVK